MSFRIAVLVAVAALPAFSDWNPKLAAEYLDARQKEWFAWGPSKRAQGACVSCHTGLTYALTRPALRRALGETEKSSYETGMTNVLRATLDKADPKPMFTGMKEEPARTQAAGVETIFAALFLTLESPGSLSADAQLAFDRLWNMQIREGKEKGIWPWFTFEADPWETSQSPFFGATVAALAVGAAPADYRKRAKIQPRIADLADYLKREREAQPLHNRLMLVWASANLPEILSNADRKAIVEEAWRKQQADGSWTLEALGPWKAKPNAPVSTGGNNYATAFTTVVLEKAGVKTSDPKLRRSLDWLKSRQDRETGSWAAESMNKQRDPASMTGKFMRDAATAFAALALVEAEQPRVVSELGGQE